MKKGALLVGYARVSKLGAREDERGANANSQVEKPEITGHGQSYLLRLVAAPLPLSLDGPFSVFPTDQRSRARNQDGIRRSRADGSSEVAATSPQLAGPATCRDACRKTRQSRRTRRRSRGGDRRTRTARAT